MILRIVLIKPSKYARDGLVDRFRAGVMPNSTLPYLASLTPDRVRGVPVELFAIDEYVHTDLEYLGLLRREPGVRTLVALVGVQSHQLHRALDLGALAVGQGALAVIGGPHPMTCDTSPLQGRGVSFALAEAERVWPSILEDAVQGELRPVYGGERRWQAQLDPPVLRPPQRRDLRRYILPMAGLYPSRGCPFRCSFCSVIKIAGRRIRSEPMETTLESLRGLERAGVRMLMFTSDNFNKIPGVEELLEAMIRLRLPLGFFAQCDAQIAEQPELVELLARAGCFQIFVGVESFRRSVLLATRKGHNRPERYGRIAELCRRHGITSHFSSILGFPEDRERDVREHLEMLCRIDPNAASFNILCPIPGTEQYDDFLSRGLIRERNLDRFDASSLTWEHPTFSPERLRRLQVLCTERFYGARHALSTLRELRFRRGDFAVRALSTIGNHLFSRYSAWIGRHPMSGGVGRVRRDADRDYLDLRRRFYGFERAPLPRSLPLPEADQALNLAPNPRTTPVVA
jgi:hypothetical protein